MQWGFEIPMRNKECYKQKGLNAGGLPAYLGKIEEKVP